MFRCFSSLGCPEFSLEETLALAARHGLDGVELRALAGTVDLGPYLAQTYGSPEALAEKLRAEWPQVRVVAFNTSLKLIGGSSAERDQVRDLAPWADALGVRYLRVFDGGRTADGPELTAALDTLRWWRDEKKSRGWRVDFMIETHDSLWTAAAIQRLLAVAPDAAILWDAHHTWKKGGEDPIVTWRAIHAHVVHIHVKDSISVPSARHPFTYTLPGAGEFPAAPLLATLRAEKFTGPISLEWERMWHPYLPLLAEALATAERTGWW